MTIIRHLVAPDLSDLAPLTPNFLLNLVLRGPGASDAELRSYVVTYIRTTDRALEEYELACPRHRTTWAKARAVEGGDFFAN
jgi:hypothetical protein